MFDSIAHKYDLVNRILTFGIDKKWREKAVKNSLKHINIDSLIVLDVACGTGDMIEVWIKESLKNNINITVSGLDASKQMLKIAKKRFPDINFYKAYATDIPLNDSTIDIISISFGIRNVIDIKKAILEFRRILKENGILLILEFVNNENPNNLRKLIDLYSNKLLPKIGGLISNNKEAYEYLPFSIKNFYTTQELINLFNTFDFKLMEYNHFNFGQVGCFIFKNK